MLVKENGPKFGVDDRPVGCDLDSPLDLVTTRRDTKEDSGHIHPPDRGQLGQLPELTLFAANHPPKLVPHMRDHHVLGWQCHPCYIHQYKNAILEWLNSITITDFEFLFCP